MEKFSTRRGKKRGEKKIYKKGLRMERLNKKVSGTCICFSKWKWNAVFTRVAFKNTFDLTEKHTEAFSDKRNYKKKEGERKKKGKKWGRVEHLTFHTKSYSRKNKNDFLATEIRSFFFLLPICNLFCLNRFFFSVILMIFLLRMFPFH